MTDSRPAGGGPAGAQTTTTAVATVARGWHVFPVLPDDKRPAITDWPDLACNDPTKVRRAWLDGHNVGIACGPSGLVVVDLDRGKPLPPPYAMPGVVDGEDVLTVLRERHDPQWPAWPDWLGTYTVRTPSGGLHMYFAAHTERRFRNSAGKLGPMIDVRADGGYVVAAGSAVGGRDYQLVNDCDPVPLPDWIARLLATADKQPSAPTPAATPKPPRQPDKYINAAFEREIEAVADAWEGGRNNQLNKSAYALARFVAAGQLDRDVAVAALTRAAETCGLEHTEITQTLRSAFTARGAAA